MGVYESFRVKNQVGARSGAERVWRAGWCLPGGSRPAEPAKRLCGAREPWAGPLAMAQRLQKPTSSCRPLVPIPVPRPGGHERGGGCRDDPARRRHHPRRAQAEGLSPPRALWRSHAAPGPARHHIGGAGCRGCASGGSGGSGSSSSSGLQCSGLLAASPQRLLLSLFSSCISAATLLLDRARLCIPNSPICKAHFPLWPGISKRTITQVARRGRSSPPREHSQGVGWSGGTRPAGRAAGACAARLLTCLFDMPPSKVAGGLVGQGKGAPSSANWWQVLEMVGVAACHGNVQTE